jgi:hypothetical protein
MSQLKIFFFLLFVVLIFGFVISLLFFFSKQTQTLKETIDPWHFRSIDTMKYSRDPSREKLNNPQFKTIINEQVKQIAETGATYVAIATPYDEEFLPILKQWIQAARDNHLHVWFRGNWSGWEQWFGYAPITRAEHIEKTKQFVLNNPSLFQDGDIFSACPECENGGPGDPRTNGDVQGHKQFLIDEYHVTKAAFKQIQKNVASNYNSMNGDVARLIMDKQTTSELGGLVVIDHYVATPEQLVADIKQFARQSGGKVILGEFGVPIPNIQGKMTEEEQAAWIRSALTMMLATKELIGVNYWTNMGGSTALWDEKGNPKKAVQEITKVYKKI